MFHRRGFFFRGLLLFLLFIGVLNVVRGASYRAAWSDGYDAGIRASAAASDSDGGTAPAPPAAPLHENPRFSHGWGFSPVLWLLGLCFTFFLFAGPLFLLLRLVIFPRRGPRGPWRRWGHGPHEHHRHGPFKGGPHSEHTHDGPTHEKQPADVEPDIRTI